MSSSLMVPQTFEKTLTVIADKGYPSLRIQLQYSLLLPFSMDPSMDFNQVVRLLEIHPPPQDHTGLDEDEGEGGQVKIEVETSLSKIRLPVGSDSTGDGEFGWVVERVRDWFDINTVNLSLESVSELTGSTSSSSLDPVCFLVKPIQLLNRPSSGASSTKPRAVLQKIRIQVQWDHRAQPQSKKRKPRGMKKKQDKRGKVKDEEGREGNAEEIRVVKLEEPEWGMWSRMTTPEPQIEENSVKEEQDHHMEMIREIYDIRRRFLCGRYSSEVPPSVVRTFDRALYKLIRHHLHRSLPFIFNQKDVDDRALELPMFRSVAKSMLGIIERAGVPFRQEAKGLFKDIQAAHQIQKSSFKQALCNSKIGSGSESDDDTDGPEDDDAQSASTFEIEISEVLRKISLGLKPSKTVQLVAPPLPIDSMVQLGHEAENDRPSFKAEPYEGIGSISDFDSDSISSSDMDMESGWATAPRSNGYLSSNPESVNVAGFRVKEEAMEVDDGLKIRVKAEEEDEWELGLHHPLGVPRESDAITPKTETDNTVAEHRMDFTAESMIDTTDSTAGELAAASSNESLGRRVRPIPAEPVEGRSEERLSTFFRRSLSVLDHTGSGSEDGDTNEDSGDNEQSEDGDEDDEIDWGWST